MSEPDWTWGWSPRSKAAAACPRCLRIHCARDVVAVGKFDPSGVHGYRNDASERLHPTREEAAADLCQRMTAQLAQPNHTTTTATPATAHDERKSDG